MVAFVADTHAFLWYLTAPQMLSPAADTAFADAAKEGEPVGIAAVSLIELVYVARQALRQS